MLAGGVRGDDLVGDPVQAFPAVFLLAGEDEDLLADGRLAIPGEVEGGDVAQAGLRGREQAQVGDVAALGAAGAAGCLAKDHDVLIDRGGDLQEEANARLAVGDEQLADGVGAKADRGRGLVKVREANAGTGGVDAFEVDLAGVGAGFAEALGTNEPKADSLQRTGTLAVANSVGVESLVDALLLGSPFASRRQVLAPTEHG